VSHPYVGLVAAHLAVEPHGRTDEVSDLMAASPLMPTDAGPSVLGFLACAAIVRRRAFVQAGGFARLLHIGGEEALLAIDLRSAGWTLAYREDVHARHAPIAADAGRVHRRRRLMRNAVLVAVMRRPGGVARAEVASLARRAVDDPDARAALVDAVRHLPTALRSRRVVGADVERELRLLAG
jgi:GT2 family glycosyltransferase